jgi:hypothetical protein
VGARKKKKLKLAKKKHRRKLESALDKGGHHSHEKRKG